MAAASSRDLKNGLALAWWEAAVGLSGWERGGEPCQSSGAHGLIRSSPDQKELSLGWGQQGTLSILPGLKLRGTQLQEREAYSAFISWPLPDSGQAGP